MSAVARLPPMFWRIRNRSAELETVSRLTSPGTTVKGKEKSEPAVPLTVGQGAVRNRPAPAGTAYPGVASPRPCACRLFRKADVQLLLRTKTPATIGARSIGVTSGSPVPATDASVRNVAKPDPATDPWLK